MFKVGQKVWCLIYGQGVIVEVEGRRFEDTYPVLAKFQINDDLIISYTADGKFHNQGNITLFPYPVEIVKAITKPSIDWSHIRSEYQYLAQDAIGNAWLFWEKPEAGITDWYVTQGICSEAESHVSYVPGTCDWKDALVKRPT